ncbi:hypothetical protein [Salinigranum halophilum]|uniref:hypothetical protein n=1 Tax=Salinigranum halophilum TaxID=2565931 RepID=UPI0010A8CF39|nr:hypothetical protein [Salinigranum halophilum]
MTNHSDDESVSPTYALRPSDIWDDYEQTLPGDEVKGICSTYWSSIDTISVPPSRFAAEFVRYHVDYDATRPGAVFSGVLWPVNEKYREPEGMVYQELVDAAYAACDNPPLSYSEGRVWEVEELWSVGSDSASVAVTEAGCAGYFENTLTILERQGPVMIRTSVKPHGLESGLLLVFAHGFQSIVRNQVWSGFDAF